MNNFIDECIDSIEHVPAELQRNLDLIKQLDGRSEETIKKINNCVEDYKHSKSKSERARVRIEIEELSQKLHSYADDKFELANQTYEVVDKSIMRLLNLSQPATTTSTPVYDGRPLERTPLIGCDMPLDPNEPRYCLCSGVSYGEMVACDNRECPIEWFHYACVKLITPPRGLWYCPSCRNERMNKNAGKSRSKQRKSYGL